MISQLDYLIAKAIEDKMPLKPKPKPKGIPIGSYEAIANAVGKMTVKPKKKRRPLPQEIASRNKKRFKGVKK